MSDGGNQGMEIGINDRYRAAFKKSSQKRPY